MQTAKDRYLFLFTDLLVIGKPILNDGETPTLDHKFIVKSIVELPKLKYVPRALGREVLRIIVLTFRL